jgi:phage tail-like protein
MSDQQVSTVSHFTLDLGGAEQAVLFSSISAPTANVTVPDFKSFDGNGNPVSAVAGGTIVTWSDVTLVRAVDHDSQLYDWFSSIKEQGVTPDTKKDITITALDSNLEPLHTWNIKGAVISSFGFSGADAASGAILLNTISLKFEDAELEIA